MKGINFNDAVKNKNNLERKVYDNLSNKNILDNLKEEYNQVYSCFKSAYVEKSSKTRSKKSALMFNLNFLLLSIEIALKSESSSLNGKVNGKECNSVDEAFKLSLDYSERIFDVLLKGTPFNYELFNEFYSKYLKQEFDSNLPEETRRKNIDNKLANIFRALFSYYSDLKELSKHSSQIKKRPYYFERMKEILKEQDQKKIEIESFIENEKKIPSLIKNGLGKDEEKVLRETIANDKRSKVYFGLEKFIYY
ncbi:MAG: hypothetical protein ACP5OZ_03445 [Candidatus Woesearchaeota archaeon]